MDARRVGDTPDLQDESVPCASRGRARPCRLVADLDPGEPPGLPKRARSVLTAGERRHAGGNLVAMPLATRSFDDKQESIDGMLRQLLGHGLLTIDVICAGDLPHIADCEQDWRRAGLRTRAPRGLRGCRSGPARRPHSHRRRRCAADCPVPRGAGHYRRNVRRRHRRMTTTVGSCTAIISIATAFSRQCHRAHLAARHPGRGPRPAGTGQRPYAGLPALTRSAHHGELDGTVWSLRSIHLTGVGLGSTLQNQQVRPTSGPATLTLAAGR